MKEIWITFEDIYSRILTCRVSDILDIAFDVNTQVGGISASCGGQPRYWQVTVKEYRAILEQIRGI